MNIYKKIFLSALLLFTTILSIYLSYIAIPLYDFNLFFYQSLDSLNVFNFIFPFICLSLFVSGILCFALFNKIKPLFYLVIGYSVVIAMLLSFNGFENVKNKAIAYQYNYIEKNVPKFLNTNKGQLLTLSYKEKDFEKFNLILNDKDEINQSSDIELNTILKITKYILPEIKEEVLIVISDDYFSKSEYKRISKIITEKLINKDLNKEQIALLKNMNFKI